MKKVSRLCAWFVAASLLAIVSGCASLSDCGSTTGRLARASVAGPVGSDFDEYEKELLKAAGGGTLEEHTISRTTEPPSPTLRRFFFMETSSKSATPFIKAWHKRLQAKEKLILQFEVVDPGPACSNCPAGCNCTNCVPFPCNGPSKPSVCIKTSCANKCCP